MSGRGFVAWANAHAQHDQALRAQRRAELADHSLRDREGLRRRLYALGSDLHAKVSSGDVSLEDAEAQQAGRGAPPL